MDRGSELLLLRVHVPRLADLLQAEVEENDKGHARNLPSEAPLKIELSDVGFSYSEGEPPILSDVSFKVSAGEFLAITGPSGCGKTTLVKILLGLVRPSSGLIRVSGVPLKDLGLRRYRELVGSVMQDDILFAGSILDNISFFDAQCDVTWATECATAAGIHMEIQAMPMQYHTLVGDMGIALSGGQRQRILLARALYKRRVT
jgi:ATP-binding cassette subfamily B protein RaxB